MNEYPEYLYHYTSIEALALILKNKTIRFTRLDLVDDPEEGRTADYGDLGRFYFVSCWTDEEKESIPMWKMYSNDLKGVRIKLPTFIFKKYKRETCEITYSKDGAETKGQPKTSYSYIKPNILSRNDIGSPEIPEDILVKVQYTDNDGLIYPNAISKLITNNKESNTSDLKLGINLKVAGKHKRKFWEFQKEYRYILFASPCKLENFNNFTLEGFLQHFQRSNFIEVTEKHIDLEVDEEKFKEMTITLSPKAGEAEKTIVDLLVQEYNPTSKIEISKVRIR